MMSYGAKGKARSLERKSIKRRGWGFCARQNAQAGVRTHRRWRRSQTYWNTSLIHRLLGIHAQSLNSSFLAHTCGFFFSFFFSTVFFTGTHLECSCVKFLVSTRAFSGSAGLHLKATKPPSTLRRQRNAGSNIKKLWVYSVLCQHNLESKSCFGERRPGRRKTLALLPLSSTINTVVPDTLFFCFLHPLHHSSSSSCPRPSFTSLIWNPSSNSGRRGRTHQLLMYSQCREKREGRLANVWNTPAEFSGACFCNLVELFLEHWSRFLLTPGQLTFTPLFSQAPSYGSDCFGCQSSSLLRIFWGKVSYRAPQISPK